MPEQVRPSGGGRGRGAGAGSLPCRRAPAPPAGVVDRTRPPGLGGHSRSLRNFAAGVGPGGEVDKLEALLATEARDPAEVELAFRETEAALELIVEAARRSASALGAWISLVGVEAFEAAAPGLFGRLVRAVRAFRAEVREGD